MQNKQQYNVQIVQYQNEEYKHQQGNNQINASPGVIKDQIIDYFKPETYLQQKIKQNNPKSQILQSPQNIIIQENHPNSIIYSRDKIISQKQQSQQYYPKQQYQQQTHSGFHQIQFNSPYMTLPSMLAPKQKSSLEILHPKQKKEKHKHKKKPKKSKNKQQFEEQILSLIHI
eukprot:TRINITY_DN10238_c0_g1_i1.p2 TRINITY_DN10238_c0_g1~~TRINITY_DN10238_c0_g1_i1.p2  ORF type:complete len:172 (-),score=23.19 TRINITY_DN10238_c0_g1_i1:156-671(-)